MSRISYRPAEHRDEAALARLLQTAPMEGWVRMQLLREPSYFAADRLMGEATTVLAEIGAPSSAQPVGMCRLAKLPVYVNGEPREAGYLAGLRVLPAFRHRLSILRDGFSAIRRHGLPPGPAPACFTSIGASNAVARRVLEARLPRMPVYRPLAKISTFALATSLGRTGPLLRPATSNDIPALTDFHNRQSARWQFAPALSRDWLAMLGDAQSLSIHDFLVHLRDGKLAACVALWDQRRVKQTVAHSYARPLDRLRKPWNLFAQLTHRIPLPAPGAPLDQAYLAFFASTLKPAESLSVVREALAHLAARGISVGVLGLSQESPLAAALRRALPATTYETCIEAVSFSGEPEFPLDGRAPQPEVALL